MLTPLFFVINGVRAIFNMKPLTSVYVSDMRDIKYLEDLLGIKESLILRLHKQASDNETHIINASEKAQKKLKDEFEDTAQRAVARIDQLEAKIAELQDVISSHEETIVRDTNENHLLTAKLACRNKEIEKLDTTILLMEQNLKKKDKLLLDITKRIQKLDEDIKLSDIWAT